MIFRVWTGPATTAARVASRSVSRAALSSAASAREACSRTSAAAAASPHANRISPFSRFARPRWRSSVSRGRAPETRVAGDVRLAANKLGLGKLDFALRTAPVVGRQVNRAAQQRGPGGVAAAGALAFRSLFEISGDVLIWGDRGGRAMPRPPASPGGGV